MAWNAKLLLLFWQVCLMVYECRAFDVAGWSFQEVKLEAPLIMNNWIEETSCWDAAAIDSPRTTV